MIRERRNLKILSKVILSLFMSFVLFLHAPLDARAIASDPSIGYAPIVQKYFPLVASAYQPDTNVSTFTYAGTISYPLRFGLGQGVGYYSGFLIVPFRFYSGSSYPVQANSSYSISVSNAFLPAGVSFLCDGVTAFQIGSNLPSPGPFYLYIYLENYYSADGDLELTFVFDANIAIMNRNSVPSSSLPGGQLSAILEVNPGVAPTFSMNFSEEPWAYDRSWYHLKTYLELINQSVINSATTVNSTITQQIANDNSISNQWINNSTSNSQAEISAANQNSQNQINAANANSQAEISAANKNADDIMHSYDSTSQDANNKKFADSQQELQETEDSLFSSGVDGFNALDMSDYSLSKFANAMNAFTFVSGFMQSLYVKMGDFGIIIGVGFVVMIASKVIGLYRFSTGGDDP